MSGPPAFQLNAFQNNAFQLAATTTLTPSLVTDTDSVYAPAAATGSVTVAPSLVTDADSVSAPAAAAGPVTLAPSLVTDTDNFFVTGIGGVSQAAATFIVTSYGSVTIVSQSDGNISVVPGVPIGLAGGAGGNLA